jgi:hypothetical protein
MSSNADSLVRDAITAYRAGKKDQARNLLLQAVGLDERHEQGWLWLSAVVDTPEDQITCLENVLTINPNNEKARQGIQLLSQQTGSKPASAPSAAQSEPDLEDEDPFANVSFTSTPQPASAPVAPPDEDDDDELPDTSSWGTIETSSASAQRPKNEPSQADYNDWISGLNIGSNEAQGAFGLAEEEDDDDVFASSPFTAGADDDDDDIPFELDRNVFGFEDEDEGKAGAGPFSASPFSADIDDDELPAKPTAPAPVATTSSVTLSPRPAAPPRSPVSKEDDFLDDLDDDDDFDAAFDDDDYDDADLGMVDPAHFFSFIPAEVKPTRLPGTNERQPALVIISLLLLVVFNGGALALVWMTLTGAS